MNWFHSSRSPQIRRQSTSSSRDSLKVHRVTEPTHDHSVATPHSSTRIQSVDRVAAGCFVRIFDYGQDVIATLVRIKNRKLFQTKYEHRSAAGRHYALLAIDRE